MLFRERQLPALPTHVYQEPDHKIQAALTHLKFRTAFLPSKLIDLVYPWQPKSITLKKLLKGYGCVNLITHDQDRRSESARKEDGAIALPFSWHFTVKFDLREEAKHHPNMIRPECVNCVVMRGRTRPGCIQFQEVTGQPKLQSSLPFFR